jgi:hypothetical protein
LRSGTGLSGPPAARRRIPGRDRAGSTTVCASTTSTPSHFLEEHVRGGPGIVHWEHTTVYVPGCDGQVPALVGLVFDRDAGDANWRYTPSLFVLD